eukprot:GFYU01003788.1.p1 GENE.GFYU01003788.1~~GFYU01003788.1.p1  ORF type:complete len:294 (+),score=100.58 GFYU01003788.1:160-1041(+)
MFKNRTAVITGASRGIGLAIGVRLAQEGANVAILAKTAEPHPKLPGTIYTAAKEIEDAGGKALPILCDIRDEAQIKNAVDQTVAKFGGIDIVINNASAISLTGTLATPLKRYDLMNQVNARGTYATTQACLPYLLKSSNPHVLNLSPPLNMNPLWFKNHTAYTIAKYGMSMCVLGMSEEFRKEGIAVNALWPQTAIMTAAMAMLAGEAASAMCRKAEIMSDAAYHILRRPSREATGQFYIDEDVMRAQGVTDFEQYACVPGSALLPDFFVGDPEPDDSLPSQDSPNATISSKM